jgi:hypothetical protein
MVDAERTNTDHQEWCDVRRYQNADCTCYLREQDSAPDTLDHIAKVGQNLALVVSNLALRAALHDQSKLALPEKPVYDRVRPLLDAAEYGSEDYHKATAQLGPAFEHHTAVNRHHPEHFGHRGVNGMNLMDVIEMLCDWHGAAQRRPGGHVAGGLDYNFEKYGIDSQLAKIIENTVEALWP